MIHVKKTNEITNFGYDKVCVEDFFDISSISNKDIISITNDLRAFLQVKCFDSYQVDLLNESVVKPLGIRKLRIELKKLGFKQWQITSTVICNKIRIAILYVDIAKNTDVIKGYMESFGWDYASTSDVFVVHKTNCRVMTFDPSVTKDISKEVFSCKYIYHWTPTGRVSSILKSGIETRCENLYIKYKPKVHLMKEIVTKREASWLGWQLYKENTSLLDGKYSILRVDVDKIPKSTLFYGDSRCECGITTKCLIPPDVIEVFGEIEYKDKINYHNEMLTVVVKNDTMNS